MSGSQQISMPPTEAIVRAANVISEGVRRFLANREPLLEHLGRYEAPIEAVLLLNVVVRHLETLTLMARHDLVLFPSAAVVARAALDSAIRVLWLLRPSDKLERETRWLAQIKEEEHSRARALRLIEKLGGDGSLVRRHLLALQQFRQDVEAMLPQNVMVPNSVPDVRSALVEFGEESKYLLYIELSQFTHPTHVSSSLYRANLGQFKKLGEFITPEMWRFLFASAWPAFVTAAKLLFQREAPGREPFGDSSFSSTVWQTISEIKDPDAPAA